MKKATLLSLLAWAFFSTSAFAQEVGYISDNLTVFVHTGPGTNYRITGTFVAGDRVQIIERNEQREFSKVIGPKGKEGWVKTDQLMRKTSLQIRLPQLEEQVQTLKMQLQQRDQQLQNTQSQMSAEAQQVSLLQKQLEELQASNQELSNELATHDETTQMQWFIRGGMVLAAGMLFGILIPFLPRRKKHDQRWM